MKVENPHINSNKSEKEQVMDIYNYLFRLSQECNFIFDNIEKRLQDIEKRDKTQGGK